MSVLVAGVDSSTQSCKIIIREVSSGAVVRSGRASHPDGSEVDPAHWWRALSEAIADAGGIDDVSAWSIAGQQHGLVALDADGEVVRDSLLWNDTRSAEAAADLTEEVGAASFAERTGLVPVASFTITKARWVADNEPELAQRIAAIALPTTGSRGAFAATARRARATSALTSPNSSPIVLMRAARATSTRRAANTTESCSRSRSGATPRTSCCRACSLPLNG